MNSQDSPASEKSIFTLSKPFRRLFNGVKIDVSQAEMRALDQTDFPLLDRYRGQPTALAQNVVAALSGMSVEEVQSLILADFAPLAEEALWEVGEVSVRMGFDRDFFTRHSPPTNSQDHQIPDDPG